MIKRDSILLCSTVQLDALISMSDCWIASDIVNIDGHSFRLSLSDIITHSTFKSEKITYPISVNMLTLALLRSINRDTNCKFKVVLYMDDRIAHIEICYDKELDIASIYLIRALDCV